MTFLKNETVKKAYRRIDPWAFFACDSTKVDYQAWGSNNPWLSVAVEQIKPSIIIEIGDWGAGPSITLGNSLKKLAEKGAVISVDTWLGSEEHWVDDTFYPLSYIKGGMTGLQEIFTNNAIASGLECFIVPFPIDTLMGPGRSPGKGYKQI